MPANKRNAPTAWNTAIVPPDIVRQPSARAALAREIEFHVDVARFDERFGGHGFEPAARVRGAQRTR